MEQTIGLFGTCGTSTWREPFIAAYRKMKIPYFNPQVKSGTWQPGMVADENFHFNHDQIVLFPVTAETTGQGSLAEIGFSIANALRNTEDRFFIFLIEDNCEDPTANSFAKADSIRSRALVKSKLLELTDTCSNIILVDDLQLMLDRSIDLFVWLLKKDKLNQELTKILAG